VLLDLYLLRYVAERSLNDYALKNLGVQATLLVDEFGTSRVRFLAAGRGFSSSSAGGEQQRVATPAGRDRVTATSRSFLCLVHDPRSYARSAPLG
jgi:hypothetical protein